MLGYNNGVGIKAVDEYYLTVQGVTEETRQSHQGVFMGCSGDLNVAYLGEQIDTRVIENYILNEFELRNISSTFQSFHVGLRNVWNKHIGVLIENLTHAEELTVVDSKETVTENINDSGSSTSTQSGESKYTDTPNQYLSRAEQDSFNGLTNYTEAQNTGSANASSERVRTLETDKSGNAFERWLELSEKNRNIIGEFMQKFAPLFRTTYVFHDYI